MDKEIASIYLNAEISCRHITNIRLALREIHPQTLGEYKWVLDWPRSQKRFLSSEEFQLLLKYKMRLLEHRSGVKFYLVPYQVYDQLRLTTYSFDHGKFNVLRDYFAIQRLRNTSENYQSEVTCTIEHRPSETTIPDWSLTSANGELITFLKSREDVNGKFEVKGPDLRCKVRSHLFPLIFQEMRLFPEKIFKLKHRNSRDQSIKPRGYILLGKKGQFLDIARVTEENMS